MITQSPEDALRMRATFMLLVLKESANVGISREQLREMFSPKMLDKGFAILDQQKDDQWTSPSTANSTAITAAS